MINRLAFDAELSHALRIRGLTLTEVAHRANLSPATVSSAISGRPVNLTTALRLTRVVSACPVVPELERWGRDPVQRPRLVEELTAEREGIGPS
jgi:predicted transcriptional regulator